LDKFVYEHRLRRKGGAKAAKATVDEWFRNRAKEKEIEKRKRAREEEDDGWTVVQQKRGRRKTSDNQGITVGGVRASTVERRRKEALTMENEDGDATTTSSSFYRKKEERHARFSSRGEFLQVSISREAKERFNRFAERVSGGQSESLSHESRQEVQAGVK